MIDASLKVFLLSCALVYFTLGENLDCCLHNLTADGHCFRLGLSYPVTASFARVLNLLALACLICYNGIVTSRA